MSSRHQVLLAVLLGVGTGGCRGRSETISRDAAIRTSAAASMAPPGSRSEWSFPSDFSERPVV